CVRVPRKRHVRGNRSVRRRPAEGRRPILTVPASNPRPALWLASGPPPAGAVHEIDDIPPGGTKFVPFRSTTSTNPKLHSGLPAGTYKCRSRIRNPTSGLATGWSPTITITLTG